jgi:hypothetical protein
LATSYQYYSDVYEYDPATIANLTRDGVNSLSVSVTAEGLDSGEESPGEEFLLDLYPDALFAYSVRKLRAGYSGFALRVRRSSDNAQQDIGFDGSGNIDETALTDFVGASNGFVVTWYDQSVNGNDVTQSTASSQPRIVNSGIITKDNSIPTVSSVVGTVLMDTLISSINVKSIFIVANLTHFSGKLVARAVTSFDGTGSVGDQLLVDRLVSSNTLRYFDGGSSVSVSGATAAQHQLSVIRSTTDLSADIDSGTPVVTSVGSNVNTNTYKIFEESTTVGTFGETPKNISEIIFYDSDQSSNRSAVNLDQKTYFGTP